MFKNFRICFSLYIYFQFIDFDLTDLANLFDFPGFDSLLRGAISDSVNSLFVLPDKYVLKLCPELDLNHMLYPLPKVSNCNTIVPAY